jgi:hypothetical protein
LSRLAIGGSDVLSFEIARLSAESPDDEAWVAKIYFAQVEARCFSR